MSRFSTSAIARDARSLRDLKKLMAEGAVVLQPQHRPECELKQSHYDLRAKHCNCGAIEKCQEAKKLLMGEQKAPKQNEEMEWDEEAEHYDYD